MFASQSFALKICGSVRLKCLVSSTATFFFAKKLLSLTDFFSAAKATFFRVYVLKSLVPYLKKLYPHEPSHACVFDSQVNNYLMASSM